MEVIPFKAEHLEGFKLQPMQSVSQQYCNKEFGQALEQLNSWSGIVNNKIVACAGVVEQWKGRGIAWAFLSIEAGAHMNKIHRAVKRYLDMADQQRIEAAVDCNFNAGIRWIEMLGFKLEGKMSKYEFGKDYYLYARVK